MKLDIDLNYAGSGQILMKTGYAPRLILVLAVALLLAGCKGGPASMQTDSSSFATVAERASFLHKYVSFRRTYESLDFDIAFHNNSGMPPGSSDWDIRLVATVPASELQAWVPAGVRAAASSPDTAWLAAVPTAHDLSGVRDGYLDGERVVGIDRARRIVVYRLSSM
jgi:hypothetical protein